MSLLGAGDLPSVGGEISGDLPSASVDASGSLPSGEVGVSTPSVAGAVEGAKAAVGDLSADVGAKMDDVALTAPDMPSVEAKKPKKGRFSGLPGFKLPSSKKFEVSQFGRANVLFFFLLFVWLRAFVGWRSLERGLVGFYVSRAGGGRVADT